MFDKPTYCLITEAVRAKRSWRLRATDYRGLGVTAYSKIDPRPWASLSVVCVIHLRPGKPVGGGRGPGYWWMAEAPTRVFDLDNPKSSDLPHLNRITERLKAEGFDSYLGAGEKPTDLMRRKALAAVDHDRQYQAQEATDTINRAKWLSTQLSSIPDPRASRFCPTYKEQEVWKEPEAEAVATDLLNQADYEYRTKLKHLVKNERWDETELGSECREPMEVKDIGLNRYPATGIKMYVDSLAAQVALRERHHTEFFVAFALCSWLKRHRQWPHFKRQDFMRFAEVMAGKLRGQGPRMLAALTRVGWVKRVDLDVNGVPLHDNFGQLRYPEPVWVCCSQQEYVRKQEAAWNARQAAGLRRKAIRVPDSKSKTGWKMVGLESETRKPLAYPVLPAVVGAFRPYFDAWATKSVLLDTGFWNLLLCGKSVMQQWLYELTISSWDIPFCRTRVYGNLLVPESTQRSWERKNQHLSKRYNFLEIPPDMVRRMSKEAVAEIESQVGRRFRRLGNGVLVRQEGNSFKSDRLRWKKPKGKDRSRWRCAWLRSSSKYIRAWQAVRPVWELPASQDRPKASDRAKFRTLPKRVADELSWPRTYATTQSQVQDRFFAYRHEQMAVASANPRNWQDFEPLMRLARHTTDCLVPRRPSLQRAGRPRPHESRPEALESNPICSVVQEPRILKPESKSVFRPYLFPAGL